MVDSLVTPIAFNAWSPCQFVPVPVDHTFVECAPKKQFAEFCFQIKIPKMQKDVQEEDKVILQRNSVFDTVKMYSEDQTPKIIEQCLHSVMVLHTNKTGARNRSSEDEEDEFFKPLHSLSHNQLIRQLFQALVQWKQEQQQKQQGVISGPQQQQQQERQKKVTTTTGKSRNSSSSSSKIENAKFSEQDIMWTVCKLFRSFVCMDGTEELMFFKSNSKCRCVMPCISCPNRDICCHQLPRLGATVSSCPWTRKGGSLPRKSKESNHEPRRTAKLSTYFPRQRSFTVRRIKDTQNT